MSYVITPSGGSAITLPLAVAEGGTGSTTASDAIITLTSPAFGASASNGNWGSIPTSLPLAPDANENFTALTELVNVLASLGIVVAV